MARELNTGDVRIEQKPPADPEDYDGDVVLVDPALATKEYAEALAFMEQPVRILLQPSATPNAPQTFPIWVNGKGAEVLSRGGKWFEMKHLPVGMPLTVKRKYLEIILRTKIDTVQHNAPHPSEPDIDQKNQVKRFTSPVHMCSILEDADPRGGAWASEIMRRNY